MKHLNFILLLAFLLGNTWALRAQYALVNIDTINYYGTTDTLDYMPIQINTNGNIVISGNQKISASQYDATTAEQSVNAVSTWISSFNVTGGKAFITCSTHDSSGNIYSAGGIRTPASNGMDMLIMKQNPAGGLIWTAYYDGPGQSNDIATAICVDAGGHAYITGASDGGLPALIDYATVKFHAATGSQVWESRYNYNNAFDIPAGIVYDAHNDYVVVSGASGHSFTDYDFALVSYQAGNGALVHAERVPYPAGTGQDKVFGMISDPAGNVYVAGTAFGASGYDAMVVKLDTALSPVWTRTLDFNGLDEAALGLTLDDSLNVIVVGATYYSSFNRELFIAKYDNSGSLRWKRTRRADPFSPSDAEAVRVFARDDNELFVGANFSSNGNQDLALLRFDRNGKQNMEKIYNGPAGGKEQFMDLTVDQDKIFVSARSFNGSDDDNIVITFRYKDISEEPDSVTIAGIPTVKNEVILGFRKNILKMGKINNKEITFGKLGDFVEDSTCLRIEACIDPDNLYRINARLLPVRKIFVNLTEKDSLSESRLGDYVRIPPFYSSLIVTLPPVLNTLKVCDTLLFLHSDIHSAQPDYTYELNAWVPNDVYYPNDQASLHPTVLYPQAHINCEPAWDYTKGHAFVRVGVYDSGIHPHIDMSQSGGTVYVPTSVPQDDVMGHGTSVAGIIAAKANNSTGVAGIAGGDAAATGTANTGVQLFNMKIMEAGATQAISTHALLRAYVEGATGTNAGGYGLHIMNHSYGRVNLATDPEILKGIDYANKNGVAFIASRGNFHPLTSTYLIDAYSAPATMRPYKVMNVGGSGTDGHYHLLGTNGNDYTSMHSHEVDFVAPGDNALVYTTETYTVAPGNPPPWKPAASSNYRQFSGTSAAAPHVSGVTALMMSYRNSPFPHWDNLVHEDCEAILKRTAKDLDNTILYGETIGYDVYTGHGRIDAGLALAALEPQYKIRHIDGLHYGSASTQTSVVAANLTQYYYGDDLYPSGLYYMDLVEILTSYSYPYGAETFLDAWPLYKASTGYPFQNGGLFFSDERAYVEVLGATNTGATLRTYACKLIARVDNPGQLINVFRPEADLSACKSAFSLYTLAGPLAAREEQGPGTDYLNVYPNPSSGQFTTGFVSQKTASATLTVTDITGRTVYREEQLTVRNGLNRYNLTLSHLPGGVYFLTLVIENNKPLVKKLILDSHFTR